MMIRREPMTAAPKVSIILPVYNVEPYLRQCLDSVVNQTEKNIQIICVNDGSTDGSRTILQEYADRDTRFEIVDQENQGAGSARNAAYPFIKGAYTYFADPDDWLNIELCEKASRRIEETGADLIYIQALREYPTGKNRPTRKFKENLPDIRLTPEHRIDLFRPREVPWLKFWNSEFLLKHQIRFSEGKRPYEDMLQSWKGCVLADRIAILDEHLYHYRNFRPGSYQNVVNQSHFAIVDTMNEIETMLKETGKYAAYRNLLVKSKLTRFRQTYFKLPENLRPAFRELVLNALSEDDRCALCPSQDEGANYRPAHRIDRCFYKMLERHGIFDKTLFRSFSILSRLGQFLKHNFLRLK